MTIKWHTKFSVHTLSRGIRSVRATVLQFAAMRWPAMWTRRARQAVIARTLPLNGHTSARRQLLVDVSVIAAHDAETGIQRVVRSLLKDLLRSPPPGFAVMPIRATRKIAYCYATDYATSLGVNIGIDGDIPIRVQSGDIFLGLDLSSHIAPYRTREFDSWRAQGVRFAFVVYDLLPALNPGWFTSRAHKRFLRWLTLVAIHSDAVCCISRAVADDVTTWFAQNFCLNDTDRRLGWFHLGAEFPSTRDCSAPIERSLRGDIPGGARNSVLMVGTVEPRKGHSQVLDAFECLWTQGHTAILTIAGRQGWNVDELAKRIRTHPEAGKRLIWISDADDMQLVELYSTLGGLIMASEGEGFGLPLIEAARYSMPIFARELPVFREIAEEHATYFIAHSGDELAPQLAEWLDKLSRGVAPSSRNLRVQSWATSADQLKALLPITEKQFDR